MTRKHTKAQIVSMASAVPQAMDQQALWDEHFAAVYGNDARAARIWRSAGVHTRHGVVDPRVEDVAGWGTEARMRRHLAEAVPLGKEAVAGALAASGLRASEIGLFAVASCTGYATPGLDIVLARDLGMNDSTQRLSIGHMGCYAAVPGLGAVADYVVARGRPAVLLCCELTSLHVQAPSARRPGNRLDAAEMQQLVTHALFADAAAAVVLAPDAEGFEVTDVEARTDVGSTDHMTWNITDLGFRMGLSPQVPDVLARQVRSTVEALLSRNGLRVDDVDAWAVHPGGPRILDVVETRLGLEPADLQPSREVLRRHGNCSSATVLLILERLLATRPGGPVVTVAFGPGLTLYTALLNAGAG